VQPLQLAWPIVDEVWTENTALRILDLTINLVYVLDIVIGFLTTYINTEVGDEIWAPRKIAKQYICNGSFVVDVLSTAPILIETGMLPSTSASLVQVLGMLKLVRLSRIGRFIANLDQTTEAKAALRTLYIVFLLVIFIHVVACVLWYMVSVSDKAAYPEQGPSWVPPLEFIFVTTTLFDEDTSFLDQYALMAYHSTLAF